jgi:hypothetical protein
LGGLNYWRVKAIGDNWPWSEIQTFDGAVLPAEKTGTEGTDLQPGSTVLHDNRPNPFNPTTEIGFSLPHASHVNLEIFNIMGQKVSTLVDRLMEAGDHTVSFDGSKVASGIYLYRLTAGDCVESKKMLLIK